MISYVVSSMAYMIAKRRPALDQSWTSFDSRPTEYHKHSIEKMERAGRHPAIAFIFESTPALFPTSLDKQQYAWLGKQFSFPSDDPISGYIQTSMRFLEKYEIAEDNFVYCYVDS